MIKLIRNEFLKLRHRPIIYISFALIFVVIAVYAGLELYDQYQYTQQSAVSENYLKKDVDYFTEDYNNAKTDQDKAKAKYNLDRAKLCLEYDIDEMDYRYPLVNQYLSVKDNKDDESVKTADKLKNFIENNDWRAYYKDRIESLENETAKLDLTNSQAKDKYDNNMISIECLNLILKYDIDPSKYNFKNDCINDYQNNRNTITTAEKNGNRDHIDIENLKRINKINLYRIENNKPPINANKEANTTDDMAGVNTLIIVMMLVIGATIFTSEFSYGTVSQLMSYPNKRWKILLSKLIVIVVTTVLMQAFLYGITVLTANIIEPTGANTFIMLTMSGDTIYELNFFYYLFLTYLCYLAQFLFYLSMVFFFAMLTKNAAASIGIVTPILLVSDKILAFISGRIENLSLWAVPTNTCNFNQYLNMNYALPGYSFPWAVVITVVTAGIFTFFGFFRFRRINV